jgi:hypothetical protein
MGRTSIPCAGGTRDALTEIKDREGLTWDQLLTKLAAEYEDGDTNSNELAYDDVRSACEKAIQEQLPDRVLQR